MWVLCLLVIMAVCGGSVALFQGVAVVLVAGILGVIGGVIWGVIQIAWLLFMVRLDQRKLQR